MKNKAKGKGSKMKKLTQPIFRTRTRAAIVMMSIALVGVWTLVFTQAAPQDNVQFILFCSTDSCEGQDQLNGPADYIPKWWQREVGKPMNVAGAPQLVRGANDAAHYRSGPSSHSMSNVLDNIRAELKNSYSPTTKVTVLLGFSSDHPTWCGLGYVNGNFSITDRINRTSCRDGYYVVMAHELGHNINLGHTANGTLMDESGSQTNLDAMKLDGGQATYLRDNSQWFVQAAPDPAPDGDIYTKNSPNCDYISGWASDSSDRNQKLTVHIYEGSTLVGDAQANQNLAGEAGLAAGHNFVWNLPASKKDGQSRTYTVYAINYPDSNNGRNVSIGQQTMSCAAPVSPPTGSGTGLTGVYFDNMDYTGYKFNRTDATVNNDYGNGSPEATIGPDTFSIRWLGEVQAQSTGTYTFYTTTDNGVRLYVNNQLVIDKYADGFGPTEHSGTISLTSGQKYSIKMEFYENGGGAVAKLAWSGPNVSKQIIPTSQLYKFTGDVVPPGQPTSLRKNGTETSSSIPLAWTAPSGEVPAKYQLYRDNVLVTGNIAGNTYNDTGLAASRSYSYFVRAVDATGNVSDNSNTLSTSTAAAESVTYAQIKGVASNRCIDVANGSTANQAKIQLYDCNSRDYQKWGLFSDKTLRAKHSGKCLDVILNVKDNGTDVQQYDCISGALNQQWVVNSNLSICSVASNRCLDAEGPSDANHTQIQIWDFQNAGNQKWNHLTDTTPPSKPGKPVIGTVTNNSIAVSWPANPPADGVTKYRVYRNGSMVTDVTTTNFNDTGLPASTTYTYTITAWDTANNQSAVSDAASGTTQTPADTTAPSAPTSLRSTGQTATSQALAWNASTDNVGVKDYLVYKGGSVVATVTTTSYNVTGLSAGQTNSYYIKARDAASNVSGASNTLTTTQPQPGDTEKPSTPPNPAINATYREVNVSFGRSTDNVGVRYYYMYHKLREASTYTKYTFDPTYYYGDTLLWGMSANMGKTYDVYITAVDSAGNESLPTAVLSATTKEDYVAPTVPKNLVVTYRGSNRIDLKWDASTDSGSGIYYYQLYRNGNFRGSVFGTTIVDTYDLTANTNYTYYIYAVDKAGNMSGRSAEVNAKTCLVVDSPCL